MAGRSALFNALGGGGGRLRRHGGVGGGGFPRGGHVGDRCVDRNRVERVAGPVVPRVRELDVHVGNPGNRVELGAAGGQVQRLVFGRKDCGGVRQPEKGEGT